jgi:signal transduction histidine kinase
VVYIANWYVFAIIYFYNTNNVTTISTLNELYRRKQKADETKDVFMSSMSQKFRNPLNSMLMSIDLLKA